MRLDHLLSKEHRGRCVCLGDQVVPVQSPVEAHVLEGQLMGGTSISWCPGLVRPVLRQACLGEGTTSSRSRVLGTLLGPEGVAVAMISGDLAVDEPSHRSVLLLPPVGGWVVRWWGRRRVAVGGLPFLENCTVDASIFINSLCSQVDKGKRWMPWHQEPMKDVGTCDKPRVGGNRPVIRGSPNGATRPESCLVTRT